MRPLKPGPKIGASQRGRKRQKTNPSEESSSQPPRNSDGDSTDARGPNADPAEWENRPANTGGANSSRSNEFTGNQDFANRRGSSVSNTELGIQARAAHRPSQAGLDGRRPLSPATTPSTGSPRDQLNMQSLSFIIHPSHETCTPETAKSDFGTPSRTEPVTLIIARTWVALGVKPQVIYRLVDLYFENFTAFSLFQQPVFEVKAQNVASSLHLHALLAAMFSFAAPFYVPDTTSPNGFPDPDNPAVPNSEHFADLAERFVQESLMKLEDESPPLCLLQALILTTYRKLIKGARGRAWRSLGTCVRLAYEMNLHLIDSEGIGRGDAPQSQSRDQWVVDEERRRAWWAVWEMDTFAGTVRRCPAAIDWSQNETYLPVDDEAFFSGIPKRSCYLERNAIDRWKALHESGNESSKAWFIIVNSLMREAQMLASPRGVPISISGASDDRASSSRTGWRMLPGKASKDVSERLGAISNALRCISLTLPPSLKYRNQYLSFESTGPDDANSPRRLHSAIYSIHLMIALAKLMIHHYYVFSVPPENTPTVSTEDPTHTTKEKSGHWQYRPSGLALDQYFEAADDILTIINRSHEDHVRYVNPFLASTVWLAAAAQLISRVFGSPNTDANLARSKFEVLYLLHKQFVNYWGIFTALQENLNTLEARLERISARLNGSEDPGSRPMTNGQSSRPKTAASNHTNPNDSQTASNNTTNHASPNLYHIPRSEIPPFSTMNHLQLVQSPRQQQQHPQQQQQQQEHTMHDPFAHNIGNFPSFGGAQQNEMLAGSMDDPNTFNAMHDSTGDMIDDLDFSMSLDMSESELQGYLGGVLSGALIG
ncbi:hypothetical protein BU16DRAFT_536191 [Lophium mytilinum]|uniref:Xylanolytic transcriptional activator regulatory domain-containing protein n=1 Tax=Lophium mytilinum TaxID=390894 RepID=A0A6A6R5S4_9PEZI|nr:hypothetical protein BU16DRAFT_536191 [Lophium mytilinum]